MSDRQREWNRLKDRAQTCRRILDDPLAMELLEAVKIDALAALLMAQDDQELRKQRDTYKTVLAFVGKLQAEVRNADEAQRRPLALP
jgi:hypothetical protein